MSLFVKQKNSSCCEKKKKDTNYKIFSTKRDEHSVNKGGNKDSEEEGEGEFRRNIRLKTGVMDRLVT